MGKSLQTYDEHSFKGQSTWSPELCSTHTQMWMSFLMILGELDWVRAFYTIIVSFTSTGFGDYIFTKLWGRIFCSIWIVVSHLVNIGIGGMVSEAGDNFIIQVLGIQSDAAGAEADSETLQRALRNAEESAQVAAEELGRARKDAQAAAKALSNANWQLDRMHEELEEATRARQAAEKDVEKLKRELTRLRDPS